MSAEGIKIYGKPLGLLRLAMEMILSINCSKRNWLQTNFLLKGIWFLVGKAEGNVRLGNLGVTVRIILKCVESNRA
jgi:hypothetical protein